MGQFLRSFHTFQKPGRAALERLIADVYLKLGVAARIVEYSESERRRDASKPNAKQTVVFVYSPPGDWNSFYPNPEFDDARIAQLARSGKLTGIYLFVYDSDNWGFAIFEQGKKSFEWQRVTDEPLSVPKEQVTALQQLLARLFGKEVSNAWLKKLLGTDVPASEEKIYALSDQLKIEGGGIGQLDLLDGTQIDLDYSLVTALKLAPPAAEKKEKKPAPARRSKAGSDEAGVSCDLLFFARLPEKRRGKFRLGFYVMDGIVLIRDLLAGYQWVGRTITEFSPGVSPKLESISRRLKLGRAVKLIRKSETPDFDDPRWEKIIEAEPFTDDDLVTISKQMDQGKVTLFFADLDEGGSFVRYTAEEGEINLLVVIRDLVWSDGTINDEDAYEPIVTYEFDSVLEALFVKTKSQFGCVQVLKETDWEDESIVERLGAWPPEGGLVVFLGPDSPGNKELLKRRLEAIGEYQVSVPKPDCLTIKMPFEPTDVGKREFQESRARLSEVIRELLSL